MAYILVHVDDSAEAGEVSDGIDDLLDRAGVGGNFTNLFNSVLALKEFVNGLVWEEFG